MVKKTKLNVAWDSLFDDYNILENIDKREIFKINANQIKKYAEPRLMTKFDFLDSRPDVFKKNNLSILPDTRGTYVIGHFDAYHVLKNKETPPQTVRLPSFIDSFNNFEVTSEPVALNIAKMTGMIDIIMDRRDGEPAAESTLTGRLKSGIINYNIDLMGSKSVYEFSVHNSQIEIDEGFENLNYLSVIEAKSMIPKNFMIRQLYYPYRKYLSLGTGKKILPVFFTHADDIYTFHVFEFTDYKNYSSIREVSQYSFIVDQSLDLSIDDIKVMLSNSKNLDDEVSFPQADSFTRILDMIKYLNVPKDKYELSDEYKFDSRQGDYYAKSLCYLGFAYKEKRKFKLTELGKKVSMLPNSNKRNKIIIQQILNKKCFKLLMEMVLKNNGDFDYDFSEKVLLTYSDSVGKLVTAHRRSITAKCWIDWILNVATV